jgi:hypothetical protein
VKTLDLHRGPWTGFRGVVAEGDDNIHPVQQVLINLLGFLMRDVDANFLHHGDRTRVDTGCNKTGAVWLYQVLTKLPRQSFSHLAPAGIAGAEEHHFHHPLPPAAITLVPHALAFGLFLSFTIAASVALSHTERIKSLLNISASFSLSYITCPASGL